MKRAWSSYNLYKYFKELNPRKIQSNYKKKDSSLEIADSMFIQNEELKHLNYHFFKELKKHKKSNIKVNPKSFLRKKNSFQQYLSKNLADETTALLDTIKVQTGLNKFSNIAGSKKEGEKSIRMVSAGTLVNMSSNPTRRNIEKKSRIQSSIIINKKKRNFSSKFSFSKIGYEDNSDFANSVVKSYLIKFNSKKFNLRNQDNNKDDDFSKTMTPKTNKEVFYNPNINLRNMMKNKPNKEEIKNDKDICDSEVYKFLQGKKNYENGNPEILKIRTEYLIKFAKINELFQKLKLVSDFFRHNFRGSYKLSTKSLINNYDECNNYLLNEVKVDDKNSDFWINILSYLYNFCFQSTKIQKLFCDELHFLKTENLMLKQKLENQEEELITKKKEINEINKLIIKYDLNSKIRIGKHADMQINKIKNKFTSQESQYVLTIHKLNQEIQNLTKVLDQNKPNLQTIGILKEQLNQLGKKYENEVEKLSQLIGKKSNDIQILTQRESNLYGEINELENEINNLKNREQTEQDKNIMLNVKIENLNKINEKNLKIIEELKNNLNDIKLKNIKEKEGLKTGKILLLSPI